MFKNRFLNHLKKSVYYLSRLHLFFSISNRMKPEFIIIGTQKGGTTSLHSYLSMHPQIVFPKKKELHFFSKYYSNGMQWYLTFFPYKKANIITGEATPNYLFYHGIPLRIKKHLNNVKFIVVLRDPIERAISHYYMEKNRGNDNHSTFEEALQSELLKEKMGNKTAWSNHYNSYIYRGKYYSQIKRWLDVFDRKQFLFLDSQVLFDEPENTAQKVFEFLNVSSFELKDISPQNVGKYQYEISTDLKNELEKYFYEEYTLLENLIGLELEWKN